MRFLCKGKDKPIADLCRQFNAQTRDGRNMAKYSNLLGEAIASIIEVKEENDIDSLFSPGGTTLGLSQINGLDDFELICFLVVR